jgi:predicted Zn-dependent protease
MSRWIAALLAVALVIVAGYVLFLNPDPVVVRLTPERTVTWPLAGALLVSFALGGLVVGAVATVRAGARGWRSWRAERRARRQAREAAVTARAQELVWAGDYTQAREELLRGAGGVPSDATRIMLLAETHLHEGNPAAARQALEDGLVRVGLEPHLLALLAEAAERLGDPRGAADALERARHAQPDSPRLARRLRDVYAAAGRFAEALAVQGDILLRVRDRDTLAHEEHALRGLRYQAALAEPEPRRAARLLLSLVREDPTFVPAWVGAGDGFVRAGRRFSARRAWERGTRHVPAVVLCERLERLNADDRKPERTTRLYRRLLRRHPQAQAVPLLFARHLIMQGALDQAGEVLSGLPAAVAGHPLVHVLWGELHRRRGDHTLSADTFTRAFGPELGLVAPYRCAACRRSAEVWAGFCDECRRWGTFEARAERRDPSHLGSRTGRESIASE